MSTTGRTAAAGRQRREGKELLHRYYLKLSPFCYLNFAACVLPETENGDYLLQANLKIDNGIGKKNDAVQCEMVRRRIYVVEEENMKLVRKIGEKEIELQKVKEENKKMVKNHMLELRHRDRKEMFMFLVLAGCVVIYACVALLIRGFV